jgi:hypothetical protein
MSMVYTRYFGWPYSASIERANEFFDRLYQGLNNGITFPINCPFEIHVLSHKENADAAVLVIAKTGTIGDDSVDNTSKVMEWCEKCDADGWEDKYTYSVDLDGFLMRYPLYKLKKSYTQQGLKTFK